MKKIYTLFLALIFAGSLMAQAPQSFKYQAVARDASGEVIADQKVGFQISILQGSESGIAIYTETHVDSTNQFGLITLEIGTGTTTDDFTAIDWGNDTYFIQIEMDMTGGTTYEEYGTSQLLSVPYAMHAKTAENLTGTVTEADPLFTAWDKDYTDLTNKPTTITTVQADAITANTAKVGIITTQTNAIIANTGKDTTGIYHVNHIALDAVSGENTGDQDLSSFATKNMANANIINLADPTAAQDAATKAYVDTLILQVMNLLSRSNETFVSDTTGIITDVEGNNYNIVKIGLQWWMAENLKAKQEADGTAIPLVTDNTVWANLGDNDTDKAYSYYNNSPDNLAKYGVLYTYAAAKDACPTGWRLPTDADWTILDTYITNDGHSGTEGDALKTTTGWNDSGNGTDDYDFSALPGGYRSFINGQFYNVDGYGYWWSTEFNSSYAYCCFLSYNTASLTHHILEKSRGFSVRCVRD